MDKKITIGLFNDSFFPMTDGVVFVVDNYAKRLCKYANVVVFVPEYSGKEYDDSKFPYEVVRCKSISFKALDYSLPIPRIDIKFQNLINKYNLDIVHIHSPFSMGLEGYLYARRHNVPIIGTMHSQFRQDFEKFIKDKFTAGILNDITVIDLFNKCDECWAVNGEIARIFYEDYGYKRLPKVMNNATEIEPIKDVKKSNEEINKLYNINKDTKVFLFVGRINTLKNILFIADSLKEVDTRDEFDFRMIFVGTGEDEDKLIDRIKELGISNKVIMTGKITDRSLLSKIYARADLFLFPSNYDASSLVQIEAASQKTPTLFLRGSATAATATENVNAFMSSFDEKAYADKIIEVMKDKGLYKTVSEGAYRDLYKSWDDVTNEVYKLYLEAIEKKRKQEDE